MRRQHINPTQRIKANEFRPIMRDEIPYYETLNRAARSAYNYADEINAYLSYGGFANVLQPGVDPTVHVFKLYEIVKITDDELVVPLNLTDPDSVRVGIIVAEALVEPTTGIHSDLVVCMFCQNFVYPDRMVDSLWGEAPTTLYLSTNPESMYLSPNPEPGLPEGSIGLAAIAVKVGAQSIAFNGTVHSSSVLNAENSVNTINTAISNDTSTTHIVYPTWVDGTSGNVQQKVSSSKLTFTPSSGLLSAVALSGDGTLLTNLPASEIVGTLPAEVLSTQSTYIGTTQISLSRPASEQGLTGITSVDGTSLSLGDTASVVSIGNGIDTTIINVGNSQDTVTVTGSAININTSGNGSINIGSGASGPNIITIGGVGDTVNINGTVSWYNTSNLEVTDKLIRINKGGLAASANNSGIEIEEGGAVSSYAIINNNRASWCFKAPTTLGEIRLTPGMLAINANIDSLSLTESRSYSLPNNSGTIALVGDTVTASYKVSIQDDISTAVEVYPTWSSGFSGNNSLKVSASNLKFNPSTGLLTAITFSGDLIGNATTSSSIRNGTIGCLWYNTGTDTTVPLNIGPVGALIRSNGTSPAWSTATFPNTTTANRILYSSAANIVSEIPTNNRGVLITNTVGAPSILAGSPGILVGSSTSAPIFSTEPQVSTYKLNQGAVTSNTLVTTTLDPSQTLDTSDVTVSRALKFLISVSSGSSFYMTELSVIHDGSTPYLTQYATVHNGSILATFDVGITGSTLYLVTTPMTLNTTYKLIKTTINV